jgi:hypothetical protein
VIKYDKKFYITGREISKLKPIKDKLWYQLADHYYPDPYHNDYPLDTKQFVDDLVEDRHLYVYHKEKTPHNNYWDSNYSDDIFLINKLIPNSFLTTFAQIFLSEWQTVYALVDGFGQCEDQLYRFESFQDYIKDVLIGETKNG